MPYRKRYKRKRKVRRRRKLRLSRAVAPVPTKMFTKLKYNQNISLNSGTGGLAAIHVFSANGLYDPDITNGVGSHQPRGFDNLIALYDHYVVLGSKITVTCSHSNGTIGSMVCVALRDSTSTSVNQNDYLEGGYEKHTLLGAGDTEARRITSFSSTKKFLGRSNVLSDSQLKGNSSTNPSEGLFWHISAAPLDSQDAGAFNLNVMIEYLVSFIEPKVPDQS